MHPSLGWEPLLACLPEGKHVKSIIDCNVPLYHQNVFIAVSKRRFFTPTLNVPCKRVLYSDQTCIVKLNLNRDRINWGNPILTESFHTDLLRP